MADQTSSSDVTQPWFDLYCSRDFPAWLEAQRVSIAFSTYQSGKLFLIGRQENNRLAINERTFNRCMGLWTNGQTLWLSSLFQVWRFENVLQPGQLFNGCDRLFVPRTGHTTGDLDTHDLALEADGRVVFVNTRFNCLATLNPTHSFTPLWRPPFISKLAAEDRCHLNGLAVVEGKVRYVTAIATSDVTDGWRDRRRDGGVVADVRDGTTVAEGLSMPHSPRWYRDRLWLLNSGTGFLGFLKPGDRAFEPLTFCPGYLRGLSFTGDYAVVGLSGPRADDKTFGNLALAENLRARGGVPRCGLLVIDLRSGDAVHWVRLEGPITELYDLAILPGVSRPTALGLQKKQIQGLLTIGDEMSL